jgi:N-methylhydantoinase A
VAATDSSGENVLGVDVGGTFTDFAYWSGGQLTTGKVPTSADQSRALVEGARQLADDGITRLLHGTTVATNVLLERKGAVTGLVTTAGFADVIQIGRQDRPSLYDPFSSRPEPLVVPEHRIEVSDEDLRRPPVERLSEVEAIAVSLLYAYAEPEREVLLAEALAAMAPGIPVSLSSEVAPEIREFERTATTVLNAYLTPGVSRYLNALKRRAVDAGGIGDIAVMRSSGGLMSLTDAARLPAAALLSGPAGGVVAAAAIGEALGRERIISFDMGGTSTDVCRIEDGRPEVGYGRTIAGYPCLMPSVAIHTVGAGGGSIAWVDAGGSLRVGPQSAGAHPGPAAYGRGGADATVTDANVVLGRIDPLANLAGRLQLDAAEAHFAVGGMGRLVGLTRPAVALGIIAVVEEVMAGALRRVSVEQGVDPRGAWLVAFGGAGGLHAGSLARTVGMAGVLIPPHAGVFSALGLLLSPPRVDIARSVVLLDAERDELEAALTSVREEAAARLEAAAMTGGDATLNTYVDVRYRHQSHELTVRCKPGDTWDEIASRFHELHKVRNGFARVGDPVEMVTVRAEAVGVPAVRMEDLNAPTTARQSVKGSRPVVTARGEEDVAVHHRAGLAVGTAVDGPAVIEEAEATTFLDHGETAVVLQDGSLEISW